MKKIAALLLGIIMIAMTACGSKENNTAEENKDANSNTSSNVSNTEEERTITWMTTRSSWDAMNEVIDAYMKENPNVKIEVEIVSDRSSYNQKLKILAASKELPDMFDSEADSALAEIAKTGILKDIDELYEELGFTDKVMEIGKTYSRMEDGKLYSLAWENNVEYFWYHKDMFDQAGITETPKTFDEFLDCCEKLKQAGITPIATWPGWEDLRWLAFIPYRLQGNNYIEGLKAGDVSLTDNIGIQAAEFYQTLAMNYFQDGWSTSDYSNALETFLGNNAAIYYIGTWQFNSFLDENGEVTGDYAYFKLPTIEGASTDENAMFSNSGTGTCVNAEKYDDALKHFLTYVLNNYPNVAFNKYSAIPPMEFEPEGEISEFNKEVLEDCSNLSGFAKTWDVTLDSATVETLQKEIVNLGMGVITPEEFAEKIDSALAENRDE